MASTSSWPDVEASRSFAPIVGKRLPVTPVPDVAAAYRMLSAEFPYAAAQIKTLMDDLAGAASAVLTDLLVGPPGCGSRVSPIDWARSAACTSYVLTAPGREFRLRRHAAALVDRLSPACRRRRCWRQEGRRAGDLG